MRTFPRSTVTRVACRACDGSGLRGGHESTGPRCNVCAGTGERAKFVRTTRIGCASVPMADVSDLFAGQASDTWGLS
jgi:hypothetical protein